MNGGTILLVEDDPDIRDLLQQVLESWGYLVTTAENGERALAWLRGARNACSLVLLDVVMPETNGIELIEELRRTRALEQLQVVIISAVQRLPEELNGFQWLPKPFSLDALGAVVGRIAGTPVAL